MLIGYHKISSLAIKLDDVISMIFQASKVFVVIFFFGCYIYIYNTYIHTVSGWWYTYPPEKYESQLGLLFPIYGKIKNVPNHQPVCN